MSLERGHRGIAQTGMTSALDCALPGAARIGDVDNVSIGATARNEGVPCSPRQTDMARAVEDDAGGQQRRRDGEQLLAEVLAELLVASEHFDEHLRPPQLPETLGTCRRRGAVSSAAYPKPSRPPRPPANEGERAEREGFEPSMDGTAHTGFRDQTGRRQEVACLQPRSTWLERVCDPVAIEIGFWESWEPPTRARVTPDGAS
jgi:hypothetical protein